MRLTHALHTLMATPMGARNSFEKHLLESELISLDQLRIVQHEQERHGKTLCHHIRRLGLIAEDKLLNALSHCFHLPLLQKAQGPRAFPSYFSLEDCARLNFIPWGESEDEVTLAIVDPFDLPLLQHLSELSLPDKKLRLLLISPSQLAYCINSFPSPPSSLSPSHYDPHQTIEILLQDAFEKNASDVHFSPDDRWVMIRYRLDGVLHVKKLFHFDLWPALKNCIKIKANLDISESRRAQDGRFTFHFKGHTIDCRTSCHPLESDENVVIRLLPQRQEGKRLEDLHLSPAQLNRLYAISQLPEGLILFTGPTGSGKTTTLYALLSTLNSPHVHIMTLEDPIEYRLPHVRQTQVHPGFDFAEGIRSMLRQDPDILLIGEIRDRLTAQMAVQAALTGHKVFSTLHAGHGAGVLARLHDLGVPRDLISSTVKAIVNQRLLRKLCNQCKRPLHSQDVQIEQPFGQEASGCEACSYTGFHGRFPVAESLFITPELQEAFERAAPLKEINDHLYAHTPSLWDDTFDHIRQGHTSLSEAQRVIPMEMRA